MMSNYSSLLNAKIIKFYTTDDNATTAIVDNYFCANKTINFIEILELLQLQSQEEMEAYKYEDYLCCYNKLLPIFMHSTKIVTTNLLKLDWLGDKYEHISDVDNAKTATVEKILLLTSMLENALGNVFFSCTRRSPPHLLRDLLRTEELRQVFGLEAIVFLKVIMGTPNSINLRNIVWHGFPKPQEIPHYYVSVLLLTIHTLGSQLETQQFQLLQRRQVSDFTRYLLKIENHFIINTFPANTLETELIKNVNWLSDEYKIYWFQLLHYYTDQQYFKFVVLILPQIELLLRLMYGQVNDYDVSAKLDEYYITMDTIFESEIPSANANEKFKENCQKNKLLNQSSSIINDGALHCIYDLFIAPYGPRLRDRVSHGEVTMAAINNATLCRILLHLSLHLLTANERLFPLANYESKFHLSSLNKQALTNAAMQLQQFVKKHTPSIFNEFAPQIETILVRVSIIQLPKKTAELLHLVLKISQLLMQICLNYNAAISARLELLAQRELHSKRRRTLEKMLAVLPQIFNNLFMILKCMNNTFQKLHNGSVDLLADEQMFDKLLRFHKHTLKICENLEKYSEKDSNEWIKALELCARFDEFHTKLYEWK